MYLFSLDPIRSDHVRLRNNAGAPIICDGTELCLNCTAAEWNLDHRIYRAVKAHFSSIADDGSTGVISESDMNCALTARLLSGIWTIAATCFSICPRLWKNRSLRWSKFHSAAVQ